VLRAPDSVIPAHAGIQVLVELNGMGIAALNPSYEIGCVMKLAAVGAIWKFI
jgi:hypothetical protein